MSTPTHAAADLQLQQMTEDHAQATFRSIMDALARPGSLHPLPVGAVPRDCPAAVTPLLALCDLMSPITALTCPDPARARRTEELIGAIGRVTGAPIVGPEDARFALALDDDPDLSDLTVGSNWSPEYGATLCQRVQSLSTQTPGGPEAQTWRLSGPGVRPDSDTTVSVRGLTDRWVAARAALTAHYPRGIDCLLVSDDGLVLGLPRTTTIEVTA